MTPESRLFLINNTNFIIFSLFNYIIIQLVIFYWLLFKYSLEYILLKNALQKWYFEDILYLYDETAIIFQNK